MNSKQQERALRLLSQSYMLLTHSVRTSEGVAVRVAKSANDEHVVREISELLAEMAKIPEAKKHAST